MSSPMTTQERINQLATAALRSAPPSAAAPKPTTFMPSFERLKTEEYVLKPVPTAGLLQIGVALNAFDAAFSSATPGLARHG